MKKFDSLEKKVIRFIVNKEGYETNLVNFLDDYLERTCIVVDKNEKSAHLEFEMQGHAPTEQEFDWMSEKLKELQKIIVRVVNLIKYLESSGYLIVFQPYNITDENEFSFGRCATNLKSVRYDFKDDRVNELLAKYFNKELISTPSLEELQKNNFVSAEERRFKLQLYTAWFAIAASIVIGLLGFFKNQNQERIELLEKSNSIEQNSLKSLQSIDEKVESNNQNLEEIRFDLDSLKNI